MIYFSASRQHWESTSWFVDSGILKANCFHPTRAGISRLTTWGQLYLPAAGWCKAKGPLTGQRRNKNSLPSFRIAKRWGSIWTSVELRGETHIEIYIPLMFQTGRIYNDNRIYYKLVLEVWKLSRITELIVLFLLSFPETHPSNIFTSKNYWPPVCFEVHLPWKQAVLWVVLTEMGWPLMWDTPDPFVHQTSEWPAVTFV